MYSANGVKHYQKPINPDPVFLGRFFLYLEIERKGYPDQQSHPESKLMTHSWHSE